MLWANEGQYYDEVRLQEQEPHYLMVPSGHFRKDAKTRALSVRTLINGVEFRTGSPIFLLETRIWASDSGTMTYQCLLGAQEDELRNPEDGETFWGGEAEAFFIRKVPLGACPNIQSAMDWSWKLKMGERIKGRQGSLAFIANVAVPPSRHVHKRPVSEMGGEITMMNHLIKCEEMWEGLRMFALNPTIKSAPRFDERKLEGWFECRLASELNVRSGRQWHRSGI